MPEQPIIDPKQEKPENAAAQTEAAEVKEPVKEEVKDEPKKDADGEVRLRYRDLKPWQQKRLYSFAIIYVIIFVVYITITCTTIIKDAIEQRSTWVQQVTTSGEIIDKVEARAENATQVLVGNYVESIRDLSLRNSNVVAVMETWFRWEGDETLDMANNFRIYNGVISAKSTVTEIHEGGVNYQMVRYTVTLSKNFTTRRFPVDAHQLHFYIESNYPVEQVNFVADTENSGLNENLFINGYMIGGQEFRVFYHEYANNQANPNLEDTVITSEFLTSVEIHRSSLGLYAKCFIALVGTIGWVLITMFINTYHHIDPLGMIPAALFGTVTNIMVGANLLPDALQMGLLEYVNILGILTILGGAVSIINVNRIRAHYTDRAFARLFGRTMFKIMVGATLIGQTALPLTSWIMNKI